MLQSGKLTVIVPHAVNVAAAPKSPAKPPFAIRSTSERTDLRRADRERRPSRISQYGSAGVVVGVPRNGDEVVRGVDVAHFDLDAFAAVGRIEEVAALVTADRQRQRVRRVRRRDCRREVNVTWPDLPDRLSTPMVIAWL